MEAYNPPNSDGRILFTDKRTSNLENSIRICGLKPSHDSGVDVCPPCAQSASNKIA